MYRTIQRLAAVVAAVGLALALTAGCTDDAPDDKAAGDFCGRLPLSDVTELFGTQARLDRSTDNDCIWLAETDYLHQLSLQRLEGRENYDTAKWDGVVEPLTGLGDEAFLVRTGAFGVTGGYRAADTVVYLNYQILRGGPPPTDKADLLVELLRTVAIEE